MGAAVTMFGLAVGVAALLWIHHALCCREESAGDCLRTRENLRRRNIHAAAGNLSYPHQLADGRVRWYRVSDDPMEL